MSHHADTNPHMVDTIVQAIDTSVSQVSGSAVDLVDLSLFAHVAAVYSPDASHAAGNPAPGLSTSRPLETIALRSADGTPLPLDTTPSKASDEIPEHDSWVHTRTLDIHVYEPCQWPTMPSLQVIRRLQPSQYEIPTAPTVVDVYRHDHLLDLYYYDDLIAGVPDGTRRHVLLYLYDPTWPNLTERDGYARRTSIVRADGTMYRSKARPHGVIIFRAWRHPESACPDWPSPPAPTPEEAEEYVQFHNGWPWPYLFHLLDLVATSPYDGFTPVGLEDIPPPPPQSRLHARRAGRARPGTGSMDARAAQEAPGSSPPPS